MHAIKTSFKLVLKENFNEKKFYIILNLNNKNRHAYISIMKQSSFIDKTKVETSLQQSLKRNTKAK